MASLHLWMTLLSWHQLASTIDLPVGISGDTASWFRMFSSDKLELLGDGFKWTEGPLWTEHGLLFSDTVTGIMWNWKEEEGTAVKFATSAGGCPDTTEHLNGHQPWTCDPEQAEPGPNGMASLSAGMVALCQHGARRLALLNLKTKKTRALVSEFNGKRFNGPNDVIALDTGDVIFTDPYYALLEKSRFYDANYTEEKSAQGFAGIYRATRAGEVKLLDSSTARPNGLAFVDGSWPPKLVVAECCQGHSANCPQGLARWKVFDYHANRAEPLELAFTVERRSAETYAGCSDGLKVHPGTGLIVSSCPQGICVVDLSQRRVIAKLYVGQRISNIVFGGGYMWVTGEERLWRLPLASKDESKKDEL